MAQVVVMVLGVGWKLSPPVPISYTRGPLSSTVLRHNPQGIINGPGHASDAAGCLHCFQPLPLLRADAAGWGLDLNAGEHRDALAHHVWGDRARGPADQIGAALSQSKLHRAAVGIAQGAGVIAMQAHRATATGQADLLLDLLLGHMP